MMGKQTLLGGFAGLLVGLVIGFWGANYLNEQNSRPAIGDQQGAFPGARQAPNNAEQPHMLADVQKVLEEAKQNPSDVATQLKAGDMYLQIQRYDEALGFYQKALDLDPGSFEANANIGRVYFEKKQFEQAGNYYEKALEINGKDAGLRSDYGLTFYLREPSDPVRAAKEYRTALEINPKHEAALQNLSVALNEQEKTEELRNVLERLSEVNPENVALQKLRGN